MREIKFRAWDKDNKKMREVTCINFYDEYIYCDETASGEYTRLPICKTPLMQSTGLKDKNGVEIYEGDILKTNSGNFYVKEALPFITLVKNEPPDEYEYDNGDYYQGGNIKLHDWDRFEVIGNIYQNSELLGEQ